VNVNQLQIAMTSNATFSLLSAFSFWYFSDTIAKSSEISTIVLTVIAIGLLGFAMLLFYGVFVAWQRQIGQVAVWLDWAWVVSSAIALLFPISTVAKIAVVVLALVVAGFAWWQQQGLTGRLR
jgi:hypothetical protein